jgi:hypothetical protein
MTETALLLQVPRLRPLVLIRATADGVYGALAERYWHRKPEYSEKNLSQCHFIHHRSQAD